MRAFSATGGLGGFRGAQDLQVFSLQGENHLEFGAARYASGCGKTEHRRRQPAGVQRRAGPLGARRAAHRLAQYVHDADIPHARSSPRPAHVGYESEAEGLLENVEGRYHITEVAVRPRVTLKSEAELEPARKTMESVEAHCFIANSINARVTLTTEFVVAPPPT